MHNEAPDTHLHEYERPTLEAMKRGALGRCPCCGVGRLFTSYLKIDGQCSQCALDFSAHRADDAPPYFVILIVGHVVVPLLLWVEIGWKPPLWLHMMVWLPLATILALTLLPIAKGALIGLQWAKHMHGFGSEPAAVGDDRDPTWQPNDDDRPT